MFDRCYCYTLLFLDESCFLDSLAFPRSHVLPVKHIYRQTYIPPPLCAGVLWPMPAWVWRDVRSVFLIMFFFIQHTYTPHRTHIPAFACRQSVSTNARRVGTARPRKKIFIENALRDLSTTLCRGVPVRLRSRGRCKLSKA